MYFGLGIMKTLRNFGSQGEPPVHPELLDWLATYSHWLGCSRNAADDRHVATYRQSSRVTPELLEKDPENDCRARTSIPAARRDGSRQCARHKRAPNLKSAVQAPPISAERL
jgi:hypothetical protein